MMTPAALIVNLATGRRGFARRSPDPREYHKKIVRARSAQFSHALMCPYALDGCNGRLRPAKSVKMTLEKSESCVECIRGTGGMNAYARHS